MARPLTLDFAFVGQVIIPSDIQQGSVVVEISTSQTVDKKKGPGKTKSKKTLLGKDDAKGTITCTYSEKIREQMEDVIRQVSVDAGPLDVSHYVWDLHGVTSIMIMSTKGPTHDRGKWTYVWDWEEWEYETEGTVPVVLRLGSTGAEVTRWQTFLLERGHDPQGIDGIYGTNTKAATEAFQAAEGITVDGVVGPQTFAAAAKYGYVAPPPRKVGGSVTTTPKASADDIASQNALNVINDEALAEVTRKRAEALKELLDP